MCDLEHVKWVFHSMPVQQHHSLLFIFIKCHLVQEGNFDSDFSWAIHLKSQKYLGANMSDTRWVKVRPPSSHFCRRLFQSVYCPSARLMGVTSRSRKSFLLPLVWWHLTVCISEAETVPPSPGFLIFRCLSRQVSCWRVTITLCLKVSVKVSQAIHYLANSGHMLPSCPKNRTLLPHLVSAGECAWKEAADGKLHLMVYWESKGYISGQVLWHLCCFVIHKVLAC